jgi:hypothetical protein
MKEIMSVYRDLKGGGRGIFEGSVPEFVLIN